mgnify:CR=1 FL=1
MNKHKNKPNLPDDIGVKLETVFQSYTVNPLKENAEELLKVLESKLLEPGNDESLQKTLRRDTEGVKTFVKKQCDPTLEKAAECSDKISSVSDQLTAAASDSRKALAEEMQHQSSAVQTVVVSARDALTAELNQQSEEMLNAVTDSCTALTTALQEQSSDIKSHLTNAVTQSHNALTDGMATQSEAIRSAVGKASADCRDGLTAELRQQSEDIKTILTAVAADRSATLAAQLQEQSTGIKQDLTNVVNDSQTALSTQLKEQSAKQIGDAEQMQMQILSLINTKAERLEKMIRVAWFLGGVSVLEFLAVLALLLMH